MDGKIQLLVPKSTEGCVCSFVVFAAVWLHVLLFTSHTYFLCLHFIFTIQSAKDGCFHCDVNVIRKALQKSHSEGAEDHFPTEIILQPHQCSPGGH